MVFESNYFDLFHNVQSFGEYFPPWCHYLSLWGVKVNQCPYHACWDRFELIMWGKLTKLYKPADVHDAKKNIKYSFWCHILKNSSEEDINFKTFWWPSCKCNIHEGWKLESEIFITFFFPLQYYPIYCIILIKCMWHYWANLICLVKSSDKCCIFSTGSWLFKRFLQLLWWWYEIRYVEYEWWLRKSTIGFKKDQYLKRKLKMDNLVVF